MRHAQPAGSCCLYLPPLNGLLKIHNMLIQGRIIVEGSGLGKGTDAVDQRLRLSDAPSRQITIECNLVRSNENCKQIQEIHLCLHRNKSKFRKKFHKYHAGVIIMHERL